jgi:chemotaxis protein CheD
VLLPSTNVGRPRVDAPGRFAPPAVALLNERVLAMGAVTRRLTARLVGGASMFASLQPAGTIQMGERNVHAAREVLHQFGIPLAGEAVGGDFGRSVDFRPRDWAGGRVVVRARETRAVTDPSPTRWSTALRDEFRAIAARSTPRRRGCSGRR